MGFPFDEADDLLLDQFTEDITDEDPDPIRARGSVHRGAAYLQEIDYPPHGASSGQEGGSMRPVEELEVFGEDDEDALAEMVAGILNDEMLGQQLVRTHQHKMVRVPSKQLLRTTTQAPDVVVLGDSSDAYCHGLDVLGAGPVRAALKVAPRMGSVLKTAPNGNQYLSKRVGKVKVGDFKSSLFNARDMGQHAIDTGKKLLEVLKKRAAAPKKATTVHGLVTSAKRPAAGKNLVHMTPVQAVKLAKAAITSGTEALKHAKKFAAVLDANAAKHAAAQQAIAAKLSKTKVFAKMAATAATAAPRAAGGATAPKTAAVATRSSAATKLRGEYLDHMSDFLGAYADTLSEELACDMIIGADAAPAPADPSAPVSTDPNASVTVDDSDLAFMDPGPKPTVAPPPEDFTPDYGQGDLRSYSSKGFAGGSPLPTGFILFTNTQALGHGKGGVGKSRGSNQANVGSMNRFLSNIPGAKYQDKEGDNAGYEYSGDGWQTYHTNNHSWESRYSGTFGSELANLQEDSKGYNWGPLIGNPYHPTFKNLRFDDVDGDVRNGRWFWFYDTAPPEARAPGDTERLNQALADWHTAKAAYDAEVAKRALQAFLDAEEAKKVLQDQAKADAASTFQQEQEQKAATSKAAAQDITDTQQLATTQQFEAASTDETEKRNQLEEERMQRLADADAARQQAQDEKAAALAEQTAQADYERYMAMAAQEGAAEPSAEAYDLDNAPGLVETSVDDGNLNEYADLSPDGTSMDEASTDTSMDDASTDTVMGGAIPSYMRGSDRLRAKRQNR